MTEDKNARTKALLYLKEVIGDDAKFNRLNDGEPIDVTGSLGGKYILYPNGHVIRLGKDEPKLGKLHENSGMPFPDVLSTVYMWITHDEAKFLRNWGCGNISVTNPNANVPTEEIDATTVSEIVRPEVHRSTYVYAHHEESWFERNQIFLIMGIPIGLLMVVPIVLILSIAGNTTGISVALSVTPTPTATLADMSGVANSFFFIVSSLFILTAILAISGFIMMIRSRY